MESTDGLLHLNTNVRVDENVMDNMDAFDQSLECGGCCNAAAYGRE